MDRNSARAQYRAIAQRAIRVHMISSDLFNAMARLLLPRKRGRPSFDAWVKAAQGVALPCPKCNKTATYNHPNRWMSNMCFGCQGKGYMTNQDRIRHERYLPA